MVFRLISRIMFFAADLLARRPDTVTEFVHHDMSHRTV
jgi:hypothetical protein